jgi:hypothetical protein
MNLWYFKSNALLCFLGKNFSKETVAGWSWSRSFIHTYKTCVLGVASLLSHRCLHQSNFHRFCICTNIHSLIDWTVYCALAPMARFSCGNSLRIFSLIKYMHIHVWNFTPKHHFLWQISHRRMWQVFHPWSPKYRYMIIIIQGFFQYILTPTCLAYLFMIDYFLWQLLHMTWLLQKDWIMYS